ncbi:MAG TPA: PPC domain-containing protein [Haliangiales bacterium]|nr:PPC domain-containing protein [Haliangiales bacterium]
MVKRDAAVLLVLLAAACGAALNQDSKTGEDGRADGADEVKVGDDGEASVKDSVSYPEGDRVDWKYFEIKTPKDINISLRWTPPRDGLDLAFNVLDEGYNIVVRAQPAAGSGKRRKEVDVKAASPGRYYVMIYAPERTDAGEYTLDISVRDVPKVAVVGPAIPDPPRLPMLPQACPPGTPPDKCPSGSTQAPPCAPNAPPGSACVCPPANTPPPCPPPPPPCPPMAPGGTQCVCADGKSPPPCAIPDVIVFAAITEVTVSGQGLNITLNRGSKDKVAKGCTGVVFRGPTGTKELPNSAFSISDVTERESRGTIPKMSLDELGTNRRAKLTCPQKAP